MEEPGGGGQPARAALASIGVPRTGRGAAGLDALLWILCSGSQKQGRKPRVLCLGAELGGSFLLPACHLWFEPRCVACDL